MSLLKNDVFENAEPRKPKSRPSSRSSNASRIGRGSPKYDSSLRRTPTKRQSFAPIELKKRVDLNYYKQSIRNKVKSIESQNLKDKDNFDDWLKVKFPEDIPIQAHAALWFENELPEVKRRFERDLRIRGQGKGGSRTSSKMNLRLTIIASLLLTLLGSLELHAAEQPTAVALTEFSSEQIESADLWCPDHPTEDDEPICKALRGDDNPKGSADNSKGDDDNSKGGDDNSKGGDVAESGGAAAQAGGAEEQAKDPKAIANNFAKKLEECCHWLIGCTTEAIHKKEVEKLNTHLLSSKIGEMTEWIQLATLGEFILLSLQSNPTFLRNLANGINNDAVLQKEVLALTSRTGIKSDVTNTALNVTKGILSDDITKFNNAKPLDTVSYFDGNTEMSGMLKRIANDRLNMYSQGLVPLEMKFEDFIKVWLATNSESIQINVDVEGKKGELKEIISNTARVDVESLKLLRRRLYELFPNESPTEHQQKLAHFYNELVTTDAEWSDKAKNILQNAAELRRDIDADAQRIFDNMRKQLNDNQGNMYLDYFKNLQQSLLETYGPTIGTLVFGTLLATGASSFLAIAGTFFRFAWSRLGRFLNPGAASGRLADPSQAFYYKPGKSVPNSRGKYAQIQNGRLRHVKANGQFSDYPSESRINKYLPIIKNRDNRWTFTLDGEEYELNPSFKEVS